MSLWFYYSDMHIPLQTHVGVFCTVTLLTIAYVECYVCMVFVFCIDYGVWWRVKERSKKNLMSVAHVERWMMVRRICSSSECPKCALGEVKASNGTRVTSLKIAVHAFSVFIHVCRCSQPRSEEFIFISSLFFKKKLFLILLLTEIQQITTSHCLTVSPVLQTENQSCNVDVIAGTWGSESVDSDCWSV